MPLLTEGSLRGDGWAKAWLILNGHRNIVWHIQIEKYMYEPSESQPVLLYTECPPWIDGESSLRRIVRDPFALVFPSLSGAGTCSGSPRSGGLLVPQANSFAQQAHQREKVQQDTHRGFFDHYCEGDSNLNLSHRTRDSLYRMTVRRANGYRNVTCFSKSSNAFH